MMIRNLAIAAAAVLLAGDFANASQDKKKPSITVRASPAAGFSPLKVSLSAEIKGGPNDFAEFYCPTVEWVWGDDTRAESTSDCDPYEEGKSEIRRRYTVSRIFQTAGNYKVEFRLKQKDKVVGSGSTTVQVRPGLRDGGGESLIPNPQSPIPNPQSPIPNPQSPIPNPQSLIPDPGCRIPDHESLISSSTVTAVFPLMR